MRARLWYGLSMLVLAVAASAQTISANNAPLKQNWVKRGVIPEPGFAAGRVFRINRSSRSHPGLSIHRVRPMAASSMGEQLWLLYTGDGLGATGVGLATLDKDELRSE